MISTVLPCKNETSLSVSIEVEPQGSYLAPSIIPDLVWAAGIIGNQIAGLENVGRLVDFDSEYALKNEAVLKARMRQGGI